MFSRAISASSSRGHECVLKIKIFRRYRFEFVLSDCRVNIVPSKWCMLCFAFGEIKPQNSTSQKVLVLFQVVNAVRAMNTLLSIPRDLSDDPLTNSSSHSVIVKSRSLIAMIQRKSILHKRHTQLVRPFI